MIVIEIDGENYYEVDTLEYNGVEYKLLSLEKDIDDISFRKIVYENGEKCISKLEDEEEFDMVFDLFMKKNKGMIN